MGGKKKFGEHKKKSLFGLICKIGKNYVWSHVAKKRDVAPVLYLRRATYAYYGDWRPKLPLFLILRNENLIKKIMNDWSTILWLFVIFLAFWPRYFVTLLILKSSTSLLFLLVNMVAYSLIYLDDPSLWSGKIRATLGHVTRTTLVQSHWSGRLWT